MIEIKRRCSTQLNEFDEKKDRLGKCYMYAYKFVEKNPSYLLVHGYIKDSIHGRVIDHAWAEHKSGNKVYDPTTDQFYNTLEYVRLLNPEVVERYTRDEMWEKALDTGVFGPWHDIPAGKVRWWRV